MILPVADKIFGDEKAIALYETIQQSPGNKGFRRYQIIHVPRGDVVCEWRKDMGDADNYKGVSLLNIPSYMEHTVDELKAIANELRVSKFDTKGFLELNKYKPG